MKDKKNWQEQSEIKQRQWQAHINAWKKSGLAQNEYCRQNNLRNNQFCYWKKKLKHTAKWSTVDFVPVPVCTSRQKPEEVLESSSGVTIILNGGIKIGLDSHFSTKTLTDVLSVLKP